MALTLHAHPLSSYCWKALIALYENETAFDFHLIDFADAQSADAFRTLWPLAKMPVLVDGGRTIVESSVIIEYLDLHHPGARPMVPADPKAAIEARMLDRIFDHYVMDPMSKIVFNRFCPDEARNTHDVMTARSTIDTAFAWLDSRIGGRGWAAGEEFGLADCAAAPALHYADKVQPMADRFPNLAAYLARLEARPSFARVLKEAEPFAHMFPSEDR